VVEWSSALKLTILLALAAVVAFSLTRQSSRLSQFYVAGRELPWLANGLGIMASMVLPLSLVLNLYQQTGDALVVGLSGVAGLLVSAAIFVPYLRGFGGYTLPDFFAERYGEAARLITVFFLILCSLPLLVVAVASLAGLAAPFFDLAPTPAIWAAASFLVVCTILGGMRAVALNQAALGVLLLAAALGAIAALGWQGGGAQDGDGVGAASLAFSLRDGADPIAMALTIAAGAACFPHVLMHGFLTPTVTSARVSFLLGAASLALLSLIAASEPDILKAVLPESVSKLKSAPFFLCVFAANLAIALGLLITISHAIGHDLYFKTLQPMATQARQLAVLRLMLIIVAAVTALIALTGSEMSDWATGSLSLAGAAFFPALVLGIWWGRTNQAGAISGMVAGVALALFYFLYFPVQFYEATSGLSGASQDQWPHYLMLIQAASLGDGTAKQAAVDAWMNGAREFATWGGVDRHYGAVFDVPLGFLVTIIVSLCTARAPADIENFVGELGKGRD